MSNILDINYKKLVNESSHSEADYTLIVKRVDNEFISLQTAYASEFKPYRISFISPMLRQPNIIQITRPQQTIMYRSTIPKYNISIPKNIICTWREKDVSKTLLNYSTTVMKEMNLDYTFTIFDDNECRDFIANHFDSTILKAYDDIIPAAFKADLWRYCYLYINGGVYLDIKTVCAKPLNAILHNKEILLIRDINNEWIYNGIIGVPPAHPLIKIALDESVKMIQGRNYGTHILDITGPRLFARAFNIWLTRNINTPIYTNILEDKISWATVDDLYHNYIRNNSGQTIFYRYFSEYYKSVNTGKRYHNAWNERKVFIDDV
jgi:mannosyltransferase OCH1-like enzyme